MQYPGGMLGKSVCCIRAVSAQYPCCIRAVSAQYPEARNITLMCSILLRAVSLIVHEQYLRIHFLSHLKLHRAFLYYLIKIDLGRKIRFKPFIHINLVGLLIVHPTILLICRRLLI